MKITCTLGGEFHALFKHRNGTICFGYGRSLVEACQFCVEIIQQQDARTV